MGDRSDEIEQAKRLLAGEGYVVLREKSYRQAQERQRVAEALRQNEAEHAERTRQWAVRAFDSQREAWDRTTYLYGLAASLGATDEQLHRTRWEFEDPDQPPLRVEHSGSPATGGEG